MTAEAPPLEDLAQSIIPIAQRAGAAILDIYCSNPNTRYKADQSPVTDADHASEDLILDSLSKLFPQIPVVAEESLAAGNIPEIQRYFFVVDPLDGTKEFIKKNGEFTVNIALVDADQPVFGLIYAPDKADCYVTLGGNRAARCELLPDRNPATRQMFDFQILTGNSQAQRPMTAIVSRSHLTPETEQFPSKARRPATALPGLFSQVRRDRKGRRGCLSSLRTDLRMGHGCRPCPPQCSRWMPSDGRRRAVLVREKRSQLRQSAIRGLAPDA